MLFLICLATGDVAAGFTPAYNVGFWVATQMDQTFVFVALILTIVADRASKKKSTDEKSKQYQHQPKQAQRPKSGSSRMVWFVLTEF